jgi:Domain of unknown function (DUF4126)
VLLHRPVDALWIHPAEDLASTVGRTMSGMDMTGLVALAAALGWASGLRLYLVVFLTGLAGALGWIALPAGLQVLQHPILLAASGFMLFVEFFADKIPGVDSLWNIAHSVISIPAGAALAAGVFGADDATMALVAGLLGGSLAATSAATRVATRAAINTSPEPFTNVGASFVEEGLVVGGLWLATHHPAIFAVALVLMLGAMIWLLAATWRALATLRAQVSAFFRGEPGSVAQ